MTQTEIELKKFWRRTGLSFFGHRFQDDIKNPMLVKCMQNGIEAQRKKYKAPIQPTFQF